MAAPRASCRKREGIMKNDYLWDGSGEPDPELQRMEKSLARLRYRGGTPDFPATDFLPSKPSRLDFFNSGWSPRFAAVTLLFLALAGSVLFLRNSSVEFPGTLAWDVTRLS